MVVLVQLVELLKELLMQLMVLSQAPLKQMVQLQVVK
jgi:hypothetical protein